MSTTLIIILLVVLALLLFAAEALILPGHGISGICAGVCVIVADVMITRNMERRPPSWLF